MKGSMNNTFKRVLDRCIKPALFALLLSPTLPTFAADSSFQESMMSNPGTALLAGPAEGGYQAIWLSTTPFPSHVEAAAAASNQFNPRSIAEDREYVGVVLKSAGENPYYLYTISRGGHGADAVPFRVAVPQGFELAAFWHTHGAKHWSRVYFSNSDTALAERWNVPIYLANHTGNLQVFSPGAHTRSTAWAQKKGFGRVAGIAKGNEARGNSGQEVSIATKTPTTTPIQTDITTLVASL